MTEKKSNQQKVFYAIAQLMNQGVPRITRYEVSKVSGVTYSSVHSILNKYEKEYQNGSCN